MKLLLLAILVLQVASTYSGDFTKKLVLGHGHRSNDLGLEDQRKPEPVKFQLPSSHRFSKTLFTSRQTHRNLSNKKAKVEKKVSKPVQKAKKHTILKPKPAVPLSRSSADTKSDESSSGHKSEPKSSDLVSKATKSKSTDLQSGRTEEDSTTKSKGGASRFELRRFIKPFEPMRFRQRRDVLKHIVKHVGKDLKKLGKKLKHFLGKRAAAKGGKHFLKQAKKIGKHIKKLLHHRRDLLFASYPHDKDDHGSHHAQDYDKGHGLQKADDISHKKASTHSPHSPTHGHHSPGHDLHKGFLGLLGLAAKHLHHGHHGHCHDKGHKSHHKGHKPFKKKKHLDKDLKGDVNGPLPGLLDVPLVEEGLGGDGDQGQLGQQLLSFL